MCECVCACVCGGSRLRVMGPQGVSVRLCGGNVWCQTWGGERTGVPAGKMESHFVIRCLLFSLLIPFKVSWDGKHLNCL